MIPYWIVFLILLVADVSVGWMISESPMPLLLVAAAMLLFGVFRLGGRWLANWSILIISSVLFLAQWWLFQEGMARVMLSDLPILFHVGVAMHFWLWGKSASIPPPRTVILVCALIAGAMIFWTAGDTEIYGRSRWMVRSLAALGLVLPVWYFLAATNRNVSKQKSGRGLTAALAVLICSISLGGLVFSMESVSSQLFRLVNRDWNDSFLDESGLDRRIFTTGGGEIDASARDIPRRANIELTDEIRMHLHVRSAGNFKQMMREPVYVKTQSLAIFLTNSRLGPRRKGEVIYDSDDGKPDGMSTIPMKLADRDISRDPSVFYSVFMRNELTSTLPLVAGSDRVFVDSIYEYGDGWWQIEPEEPPEFLRFSARVPVEKLEPINLKNQNLDVFETLEYPYLSVPPDDFSKRVGNFVREKIDPELPLPEKLEAVRTLFENEYEYALRYDNVEDLEPLENFLFAEKKGHCELFASAAVMLLRHLNVPSRMAYGYLGGEFDLENQLITFRDRDYHAWPEIYLDGQGWTTFDTTPQSSSRITPPQPGRARAGETINLDNFEEVGKAEEIFNANRSRFEKFLDSLLLFLSRHFVVVLGFFAIMIWLWIVLSRKSRANRGGFKSKEGIILSGTEVDELPRFVDELIKGAALRGIPKKASQTWQEFLNALKIEGHCNGEFDEMIGYLYDVRYCSIPRDRAVERRYTLAARDFRKDQKL